MSYIDCIDEYFMDIAFLSAKRSKNPVTQVGACIVNNDRIIGIGYNEMLRGCSDDEFSWKKGVKKLYGTMFFFPPKYETMNETLLYHLSIC